ncbi:hypothetical protein F5Y10DRAFT_243723 [Nemania abortiva]|nr:hypothetical protein F5Y10DRAFT_243723 [Nemania abortiva]
MNMASLNADSLLLIRVYIALECLVTFSVVCRFLARWKSHAPVAWDDAWVVIAWVFYITVYFSVVLRAFMLGSAQLQLSTPPLEDLFTILKLEYAGAILFETANIAAKVSLLCLYRRIFTTRTFRKWSIAVFTFCIIWYISSLLTTLFQCWPVHQAWNPLAVTGVDRKCIDLIRFILGYEIGNIVADVLVLCLPMRMIQ